METVAHYMVNEVGASWNCISSVQEAYLLCQLLATPILQPYAAIFINGMLFAQARAAATAYGLALAHHKENLSASPLSTGYVARPFDILLLAVRLSHTQANMLLIVQLYTCRLTFTSMHICCTKVKLSKLFG